MKDRPASFLKAQKSYAGRSFFYSILFSLLGALVLIGQSWLLAYIINAVVFEAKTYGDVSFLLVLFPVVFLTKVFLSQYAEILLYKGASSIKANLRRSLHDHIKKAGPLYVIREGSAALIATLTEGIETIEAFYTRYIPAVKLAVLIPFAILLVAFPFDWVSALVLLVTAPLIPFFMILIGKGTEKLNQKQWRKLARMSNHFLDMIQGLTTLKLFNASHRKAETISKTALQYKNDTMEVLRIAFLSSLVLEFFATVSIAIIAVLIGFRLLYGEMAFFEGFFILLLAPEFYQSLRKMGGAYHAKMEAIGAAEKMEEIMQASDFVCQTEDRKAVSNDFIEETAIQISFKDVSFSYSEGTHVLNKLNFDIEKGEHIALVGPSGAGKSTILALLLGFITPDEGEIRINNMPLSALNMRLWRSCLSWIPQKPTLFYGTILDNLRLGNEDISEDLIKERCRQFCATEFIESLPYQYNSLIGEQGYGLSGGQIQRLALVRAFLQDSPLLLLDEPSASLDRVTENLLHDVLPKLTKDKTVITIAHRLHTIKDADRILFLEEGNLVEDGSHEALCRQEGRYADLIRQKTEYLSKAVNE